MSSVRELLVVFSAGSVCVAAYPAVGGFGRFHVFSPINVPYINYFVRRFRFVSVRVRALLDVNVLRVRVITGGRIKRFVRYCSGCLLYVTCKIMVEDDLQLMRYGVLEDNGCLFDVLHNRSFTFHVAFMAVCANRRDFGHV